MANIDILITVDAAAIAAQVQNKKLLPGTAARPTSIGAYSGSLVYIAAAAANSSATGNNQKLPGLTINAHPGDVIRWMINAFNNADNTVYLYNSLFSPAKMITSPVFDVTATINYLPPADDVRATPVKYENQAAFSRGAVLKTAAKVQYTCCFAVADNASGGIIGHFSWSFLMHLDA